MSDIKQEIEKKIKQLEDLGKERAKTEVLLEQAMQQLKDMGLNTIEEAQEHLAKLIDERDAAEAEAERLLREFNEKYKDLL